MELSGKSIVNKGNVAKVVGVVALWELAKLGYRKLGEISAKHEISRLSKENTILRALLGQEPVPLTSAEVEAIQQVEEKATRKTGTR